MVATDPLSAATTGVPVGAARSQPVWQDLRLKIGWIRGPGFDDGLPATGIINDPVAVNVGVAGGGGSSPR